MPDEPPKRTYLRRRGRMTRGQQRALQEQAHLLVTNPTEPIEWDRQFGRTAPLGVEIGFGMGHALLEWAVAVPSWNLVGLEVYQPGIGALLLGVAAQGAPNVRVLEGDAGDLLATGFAPASIDEIRIFFPDPWPKARHHKRRLVQAPFVSLLASRLRTGGRLLLATDWAPYAEWMLEVLEAESLLENLAGSGFADRLEVRPVTRFEARGQRLGHAVWDLAYARVG